MKKVAKRGCHQKAMILLDVGWMQAATRRADGRRMNVQSGRGGDEGRLLAYFGENVPARWLET